LNVAVWLVCGASVAGMLARPRGSREWMWALGGAAALIAFGLVSPGDALRAVRRGTDVYFFLAGMMVLAELARREGVFDWLAGHAARAARGSPLRLLALVYGVGTIVTALLSNDATAVVLTPAVAAVARKANAAPLPHLYACAFVANAASFILPISNPANLVVYAGAIPPLGRWLALFGVPSILSLAATFAALVWIARSDLKGRTNGPESVLPLGSPGRAALGGIALTALALIAASALAAPLGAVTLAAAAVVLATVTLLDRYVATPVLRSVSWGVLVLVAGLFILVQGLDGTGLLDAARRGAETLAAWPLGGAAVTAAVTTALASNVVNNLPAGLVAGTAVSHLGGHAALKGATAIGIDLGPNLSVTGSLATILWMTALRREGIAIDAGAFLRAGIVVMPPALLLAIAGLYFAARF